MMPLIIFCSTQNLASGNKVTVQQKESVAFEESEFFVTDSNGDSILPIDPVTLNISVQSTDETETADAEEIEVTEVAAAQAPVSEVPEAKAEETPAAPEPEPAPEQTEPEEVRDVNQPTPGVTYYNVPLTYEQQEYTMNVCAQYGVDVRLMFAMMAVETNFTVNSVSAGCYGILQINSCHLTYFKKTLGVTEIKSFESNVLCGTYMMSGYLSTYGDISKALVAYNCGSSNAEKLFAKGIYQTSYSKKIISKMETITTL